MLESSYSSSALASADKASLLYVNPNSSKSSIYNNPSWKTTATSQPASKLSPGHLNINSGTTTTTTPKPIHTGPKSAQSKGSPFFFYESNSKLVSLKKFYESWSEQLGDGSIYSKKQGQKEKSLQAWFDDLQPAERAVCLTVMDTELVTLVRQLLVKYIEYGGRGYYQSKYPEEKGGREMQAESHLLEKAGGDLHILFRKPSDHDPWTRKYDHYGPSQTWAARTSSDGLEPSASEMANFLKLANGDPARVEAHACDIVLQSLAIIEVAGQEALTLTNSLLENTNYLLEVFRQVNSLFLRGELKIDKCEAVAALEHSGMPAKRQLAEKIKRDLSLIHI